MLVCVCLTDRHFLEVLHLNKLLLTLLSNDGFIFLFGRIHARTFSFLSFWAVGAPKYTGIQLSFSSRSRCNSHGGGALGTQMNLFDRFARVVKVI